MSLTVSDLDTSQDFYTSVLDFVPVLDVGYGRIFMHPGTGFTLSLMKHDKALGGAFTELTTGLDHLGLTAASRADLEGVGASLRRAGRDLHTHPRHGVRVPPQLPGPRQHRVGAVSSKRTPAQRPRRPWLTARRAKRTSTPSWTSTSWNYRRPARADHSPGAPCSRHRSPNPASGCSWEDGPQVADRTGSAVEPGDVRPA